VSTPSSLRDSSNLGILPTARRQRDEFLIEPGDTSSIRTNAFCTPAQILFGPLLFCNS